MAELTTALKDYKSSSGKEVLLLVDTTFAPASQVSMAVVLKWFCYWLTGCRYLYVFFSGGEEVALSRPGAERNGVY